MPGIVVARMFSIARRVVSGRLVAGRCGAVVAGTSLVATLLLLPGPAPAKTQATPPTNTRTAEPAQCDKDGLALQVLGSGGPIADDARASSGYLLWLDGQARVLVDAGGGTFLRFGQAGASLETLELIAITHLHTDHVADLPALLKGAYFSERDRPLALAGPDGNERFPGIKPFLDAMFGEDAGAFGYLSGLLDGTGRLFELQPTTVDHRTRAPVTVLENPQLNVDAIGVDHGPVPSLAYRIDIAGRRIVVSGDQNLSGDGFTAFARGADLLVMPFAIPQGAGRAAANLHARPADIGRMAAEAEIDHLVLSHFMARSLRNLDAQVELVREHFKGRLTLAEDLLCVEVPAP